MTAKKIECKICGIKIVAEYKRLHEDSAMHQAKARAKKLIKQGYVRLTDAIKDLSVLPKWKTRYGDTCFEETVNPYTGVLYSSTDKNMIRENTHIDDTNIYYDNSYYEYWVKKDLNAVEYVTTLINQHNEYIEERLKDALEQRRETRRDHKVDQVLLNSVKALIKAKFEMDPSDFKKELHYGNSLTRLENYKDFTLPLGLHYRSLLDSQGEERIGYIYDGSQRRPWAIKFYDVDDITINDVIRSIYPPRVRAAFILGEKVTRQGDYYFVEDKSWEPDDKWTEETILPPGKPLDDHNQSHIFVGTMWKKGWNEYMISGRVTHPQHQEVVLSEWNSVYRACTTYRGARYD